VVVAADYSRCDDKVLIEESKTLKDLIRLFCAPRFKHRLHRVAVTTTPTSPVRQLETHAARRFPPRHAQQN
jgi:hypothetical protein